MSSTVQNGFDQLLLKDHTEFDRLLKHYDKLTATSPSPRDYYRHRQQCINELVRLASVHWYVCETVLLPALDGVLDVDQLARARAGLHKSKEHMAQLDSIDVDDGVFADVLVTVRQNLIIERQKEMEWLHMLAASLGASGMRELAATAGDARLQAPTRPHPSLPSPDNPIGRIANVIVASVDCVSDYGREFDEVSHRQNPVLEAQ